MVLDMTQAEYRYCFMMFRKHVNCLRSFKKYDCNMVHLLLYCRLNRFVPAAVIPLRRPAHVIYCATGEPASVQWFES